MAIFHFWQLVFNTYYTWMRLNYIHVDSKYNSSIEEIDGITNILLTGIDARPGETASRTDAMMILTIDKKHDSIKLTSLARDTYVQIPGRNKSKLNTAYFWGGEELLFKTIENEFGIGVDKFIQVDFSALMDIIRNIKKDLNKAIFLIEHDMKLVMGISDRIVVLDYGKKIAEGSPEEIRNNPSVIQAYLGKEG